MDGKLRFIERLLYNMNLVLIGTTGSVDVKSMTCNELQVYLIEDMKFPCEDMKELESKYLWWALNGNFNSCVNIKG